jgi:hypothetical protein
MIILGMCGAAGITTEGFVCGVGELVGWDDSVDVVGNDGGLELRVREESVKGFGGGN